jgi:hypothetical protein
MLVDMIIRNDNFNLTFHGETIGNSKNIYPTYGAKSRAGNRVSGERHIARETT